jgi:hypothetical protein
MTFQITLFTAHSGLLTKTIRRGANGRPDSISAHLMNYGTADRLDIETMGRFAELLNGSLLGNQAISSGCIRPDKGNHVLVNTARNVEYLEQQGDFSCISRSKQYLEYKNRETLLLVDTDLAQAPDHVKNAFACGCRPLDALASICPELDCVGHVMRRSTSSGLMDLETGEMFPDSGGWHTYFAITDGTDTRDFTNWLHDSSVLVGMGWAFVTACGSILRRSIVDKAVASPERLIYESMPIVEAPLWQDPNRRLASYVNGKPFNSRARRVRSAAEKAQIEAAWDAEEAKVAPRAAAVQAEWVERKATEMRAQTGKSMAHCRRVAERWVEKDLLPEALLEFKNLGIVSVAQVWEDPYRFAEQKLADPIEGAEYKGGLDCAILLVNKNRVPWIYSHAHGGQQFSLCREDDWYGNARAEGEAYGLRALGFGALPIESYTPPATCEHRASTSKADLSDKSIKAFAFKLLRAKAPADVLVRKVLEANRSLATPLDEARVFQNIAWAHSVHYAI